MDINQYKDQFLSEAREHIDNINDSLLGLEKEPDNADIINKLFRSFHTLKGNAATMGYNKFSELAHHLEDVLDKVRSNKVSIDSDMIDTLFEGIDLLETGLQMIQEDKSEEFDYSAINSGLEAILHSTAEPSVSAKKEEVFALSPQEEKKIEECKAAKKEVYDIRLIYEKDNSLKGPKSLIIMRNLSAAGEIIKTFPKKEDIVPGKFDTSVIIIFASDNKKEAIEKIVDGVSGLSSFTIEKFDPDKMADKPAKGTVESKETDKADITKKQQDAIIKQIQSVKIDIKSLDNLMNLVGELLISKIRLEQIAKDYADKNLDQIISNLARLTVDIQDEVMKQRMIPIGNIFNRFPRMVRDLAKKEKKKINLEIIGEDIEFDRTILDEIGDPLVHLLRNCVDHGIETPEERKASGKSETGTVKLVAMKEKSNAIIEISDDGQGIDAQKVKESSIRKGMITEQEAEAMDEKALIRLIFRPGVSTNKVVTEVSGRGVGMDVVETKIKALGGNVKLDSRLGLGTQIRIQLPLTLAIINSLLVQVDESRYAVPLNAINRTVKLPDEKIKTIQGHEVFLLMNEDIPIVWLTSLLHGNPKRKKSTHTIVIVDKDDSKVGLVVDSILSQQQVLIKSLDEIVTGIKGLGGATILGDGRVAMIIDVATLLD